MVFNSCRPYALLIVASLLTGNSVTSANSILGDTVEIWSIAQLNGSETLRDTVLVTDPGVEYTAMIVNNPIYDLDLGAATITLNSLSSWFSPWFNSDHDPTALEFRDIDVPGNPNMVIGGVDVIFSDTIVPEDGAPMGYPEFSANNVSFEDHSVRLTTGPYSFPEGSRVLISLTFVPEPSTACLLVAAGLLVPLRRRS